ncbi:multiple inositol polyphosphate phosphatase 1-like isoform X4 [Haemaphysalis longicornis]
MNRKGTHLSLVLLVALVIVISVIVFVLLRGQTPPPACYPESREETCYEGKKDAYRLYGTKTDYRVLVSMYELDKQKEYVVPDCTPQGLFLFNRHTTRYPDKDDIEKMVEAMPRLQSNIQAAAKNGMGKLGVHLCKSDLDALSNWTLRFKPDDDNHVTPSGQNVSYDQAKRFLAMFPKLFSPFRASDYVVGFTSRVRTLETAKAFLHGLLSETEFTEVEKHFLPPQDDILQFHKECDKISKEKAGTPPAVEAYEKGPYWQRLLATLTWRLGFNVTKADLKMLLRACQFEYATYDTAPWCAVFTEDDLKASEFREDLDDYYKDGYGRERNYVQACPVITELVTRLKVMSKEPQQPNKILFFSHAGGFKKVVARLGLNRDSTAPTADHLCSMADRQWRSSLLCPFNANVAFVLFKCPKDSHKVVTFLNERPQQIPGCPSHHCPLETFLNIYKEPADTCNITEICSVA